MDFINDVRTRSSRFRSRLEHLNTEEATKTALVMPFIQLLGYNIFDPTEVVPEYIADFGNKKGEKVDYALMLNGMPVVLIEAKKYGANLKVEQESQLFRYFSTNPSVRFGILTDGIVYRFYSDLDDSGSMDKRPFFKFNMLDITDLQVGQLEQFRKGNFDPEKTVESARELKYTNEIKRVLTEEMEKPCGDFVRLILTRIEYSGSKAKPRITKPRIVQFTPLVQQAFSQFVKDQNDPRPEPALERGKELEDEPPVEEADTDEAMEYMEYPLHLSLNSKGVQAKARYDGEGSFVVLSGSEAVKEELPSMPEQYAATRKALMDEGILVDEGTTLRLTSDQTFNTSSGAASFLLAGSRSGLRVWRDAEGRPLRDLVES